MAASYASCPIFVSELRSLICSRQFSEPRLFPAAKLMVHRARVFPRRRGTPIAFVVEGLWWQVGDGKLMLAECRVPLKNLI